MPRWYRASREFRIVPPRNYTISVMFYVCILMILQFIYTLLMGWRMDKRKAYKAVLEQNIVKVVPI